MTWYREQDGYIERGEILDWVTGFICLVAVSPLLIVRDGGCSLCFLETRWGEIEEQQALFLFIDISKRSLLLNGP